MDLTVHDNTLADSRANVMPEQWAALEYNGAEEQKQ